MQKLYYSMYDLQTNIDEYSISELEAQGKIIEAIEKGKQLVKEYEQSPDPNLRYMKQYIQSKIDQIMKEHNIKNEIAAGENQVPNN